MIKIVSAVAQGCPLLSSITLDGCSNITDVGVSALAQGCRQLSSINLRFCHNITDVGVSALADNGFLLRRDALGLYHGIYRRVLSGRG